MIPNVECSDTDADGCLNLPYCTSWENNAGGVCATEADAKPGTTSKCNCDNTFNVPVEVTSGELSVTKAADPTSLPEPGGTVDFTVTVTNIGTATVTLSTIVDDPDNNPATNNSTTYQASAICGTTSLPPSAFTTCTFTQNVSGGPGSYTDRACANGTDTHNDPVSGCGLATVTIGNVNPSATVTKTPQGTVCATVRYAVSVQNTDVAEAITLDKLCDNKFGTIVGSGCTAGTEGAITGTTCEVPRSIAIGGTYNCTFDAEVCSAGHQDIVTATVSDDDGHSTDASGSATVSTPPAFLPVP